MRWIGARRAPCASGSASSTTDRRVSRILSCSRSSSFSAVSGGPSVIRTRVLLLAGQGGAELLESRERLRRLDSQSTKRRLLFRGEVRDEGEVVLLRAPLQAELIVHAAVALAGKMERQHVERRLGHAPGKRVR